LRRVPCRPEDAAVFLVKEQAVVETLREESEILVHQQRREVRQNADENGGGGAARSEIAMDVVAAIVIERHREHEDAT
jgi:hypothetical protein